MTMTPRTSARSTPSSPTRPATWPTAACWSSSFPGSASRSRPAISPPTTGGRGAGPSPTRSARSSTRWCLMAYRKADPVPDAHAESMVLEWAVGEPEPMRPDPYPSFTPKTTPSGDILFTTRTVDPVAAAAEARRSGLWTSTEITDTLWPARDTRTRPLMPLRRGHMAMLVAAGFLDNLCLEAEGPAHTGQGPHLEGDGHGGGLPGEGGPPGEAQDHRGRPGPARRRDHRHRSIDGSPTEPHHEAPLVTSTCGAFALPERFRNTHS